jgi:energy-coupling factor transport system permease protein
LIATDDGFLRRLAPEAPTAYHRLNPLTKAALASTATIVTLALGGYLAPTLLFAALVLPSATVAGEARRVVARSAVVALPLAIAVGLVSIFTRHGATVLFTVGPFNATLEGVEFAAQVVLRLFVMASALTLFGLTTAPRAFVADLERRGIPPRFAFAVGAVLDTVPALVARGREVLDAQRARGLDTEGGVGRRASAVVPLVGPVVIGALHHVEARSLALEARGFGRPGPRHLLWAPPDTRAEQAARWLLVVALAGVVLGVATGTIPRLP